MILEKYKKKKFAILIAARSDSVRLPGKHLKIINEKRKLSVLDYCIKRCRKSKIQDIILCTSSNKNDNIFEKYAKKLEKYENVAKIYVYKFDENIDFPQLEKAHVSEATYYRLMIENYIPKEIDNLIYLDSDVIAMNNPYDSCKHVLDDLNKMGEIVGVSTEMFNSKKNEHFKNIELTGYKYFNAGVMLIDFEKWQQNNFHDKLIKKLKAIIRK